MAGNGGAGKNGVPSGVPATPTDKVTREYDRLLEVVRSEKAAGHNTDEAEAELQEFMAQNPGLGEGGFMPVDEYGDPE